MLIWDCPAMVNEWVGTRGGGYCEGGYTALGWAQDEALVAGLVFYSANEKNCFVNIALARGTFPIGLLKAGLRYVFSQLKLSRLTFTIEQDNIRSQNLVTRLGATLEATLQGAGNSGDLLIFKLRPETCPIWSKLNGQGFGTGGT